MDKKELTVKAEYNLIVPVQYGYALSYGYENLTTEEETTLKRFLESLPKNGTWDFSNDSTDYNFNDVDRYAFSQCYLGTYTILV